MSSAVGAALAAPSARVCAALAQAFALLGRALTAHRFAPLVMILAGLTAAGALLPGLALLEQEHSNVELYPPRWGPGSRGYTDFKHTALVFEVPRMAYVLARPPVVGEGEGGVVENYTNALTDRAFLVSLFEMHAAVEALREPETGATFRDLCAPVAPDGPCTLIALPEIWDFNVSAMLADPDPVARVAAHEDALGTTLGGKRYSPNGTFTGCRAVFLAYGLSPRVSRLGVLAWERTFIARIMRAREEGEWTSTAVFFPFAETSFDDEVDRIVTEDTALVFVSVAAALVYMSMVLGRRTLTGSKVLLGLSAVGTVALALGAAFGACGYFGVVYSTISPLSIFVLVGIGVDDQIIMVDAVQRARRRLRRRRCSSGGGDGRESIDTSAEIRESVCAGLADAGPTITISTLTNVGVFVVGAATSSMRAVSGFCTSTGLAITFVFFLQSTVFAACLVLDAWREGAQRVDCAPCIRLQPQQPQDGRRRRLCARLPRWVQAGAVRRFIGHVFAPLLLYTPGVRVCVVALFALGFAGSVWASTHLEVGIPYSETLPGDSYVSEFLAEVELYFDVAKEDMWIIVEGGDYADAPFLVELDGLLTAFRESPFVVAEISSWLHAFAEFCNFSLPDEAHLPAELARFFSSEEGALLRGDVVFSDGNVWDPRNNASGNASAALPSVAYARYRTRIPFDSENASARIEMTHALYDLLDARCADSGGLLSGWLHSLVFPFAWGDAAIVALLYRALALSGASVTGVLLLFLHPLAACTVGACILSIYFDLLAWMWAAGIPIDPATYIGLVMSVGLSVDYSTHIAVAISRVGRAASRRGHHEGNICCPRLRACDAGKEDGASTRAAASAALRSVGVSVLNGGVSTLLGVAVLAAGRTAAFVTFFKMLAATVLLGLLHGLVLLPALLSFVPASLLGIGTRPCTCAPFLCGGCGRSSPAACGCARCCAALDDLVLVHAGGDSADGADGGSGNSSESDSAPEFSAADVAGGAAPATAAAQPRSSDTTPLLGTDVKGKGGGAEHQDVPMHASEPDC